MVNVTLYNMNSPNNKIGKNKTIVYKTNCDIYKECDIESPTLIISYDDRLFNCNYIYIEQFKRYYFISNSVILNGNKVSLTLRVDVLETYKENIKKLKVNVIRNQYKYNLNMHDNAISITEKTHKSVYTAKAPDGGFPFLNSPNPQGHCFVLNSL